MLCEKCKAEITLGETIKRRRSDEISRHFHAHVTQISRETGDPREKVYWLVLCKAIETECDGGGEYPYQIVRMKTRSPITGEVIESEVACPLPTSERTNKQMMTAVEAAHRYALTDCDPPVILHEKEWYE